jgi:hypothetical protein
VIRGAIESAAGYGSSGLRVALRQKPWREGRRAGGPIFVVGAPRSGTTFVAGALAAQDGIVDLGEVKPLKAAIPGLARLGEEAAAERIARILGLTRRLALAGRVRFVEQTPEVAFVAGAALRAFPGGRAVHKLRDGRDVVCSLLERGWLSAGRAGADDAHLPYGAHARFWVEPGRKDEFARASDATRAAWAWRRYVEAARGLGDRALEVRYEAMVGEPDETAERLAAELGLDRDALAQALAAGHVRSVGRWRRDLSEEQVADVEREAGPLLRELGYS